jgi:hypothetical protein
MSEEKVSINCGDNVLVETKIETHENEKKVKWSGEVSLGVFYYCFANKKWYKDEKLAEKLNREWMDEIIDKELDGEPDRRGIY